MDDLTKRITYEYPYFEEYLQPQGFLPIEREAHACFYYGMLAQKAIDLQGKGPESQTILYKVGDTPAPWFAANLAGIARGVAMMYVLESPEDFLRFRKEAWLQAKALGVVIDDVVFKTGQALKFDS